MRVLLQIGLCCLLAGSAVAQRGGGSRGGGGFHGGAVGGFHGGGGFAGGGFRGGGFVGRGFRGGFVGGFRGYSSPYLFGSSYYYTGYYDYSPYISNYAYPAYDYNPSPNVTVVYAQQPAPDPAQVPVPVYTSVAASSGHTYDQYGQEVKPAESSNASPIYLVAMKDHTIYAAGAYWVDGKTLHYVTLQHQEKQAPLDQVDGAFSQQLNRERRVAFHVPSE